MAGGGGWGQGLGTPVVRDRHDIEVCARAKENCCCRKLEALNCLAPFRSLLPLPPPRDQSFSATVAPVFKGMRAGC